jgi:hypothetical protein
MNWRRTLRTRARSAYRVNRHRLVNRWWDMLAVVQGYCNHRPDAPEHGRTGGYAHWRCARRRGHLGLHRYRNYVWDGDGRTEYDPVEHAVRQPHERHLAHRRAGERALWREYTR